MKEHLYDSVGTYGLKTNNKKYFIVGTTRGGRGMICNGSMGDAGKIVKHVISYFESS